MGFRFVDFFQRLLKQNATDSDGLVQQWKTWEVILPPLHLSASALPCLTQLSAATAQCWLPPPPLTHNRSINPKWAVGGKMVVITKNYHWASTFEEAERGACTRVRTCVGVRASKVWSEEGIIGGRIRRKLWRSHCAAPMNSGIQAVAVGGGQAQWWKWGLCFHSSLLPRILSGSLRRCPGNPKSWVSAGFFFLLFFFKRYRGRPGPGSHVMALFSKENKKKTNK